MKPQPPRTPSKLSDSVHHQLKMYALAASAVGVGTLALSQAAEAKVVYTPADTPVDGKLHIDLNNDGIWDFIIFSSAWCATSECAATLWAEGASGNGIAYRLKSQVGLALALKRGKVIDSKRNFNRFAGMAHYAGSMRGKDYSGYWVDVTNRYLGLKFQIKGKTHHGWARMTVNLSGRDISATLTGYAYETIPNKAIIAGKTRGAKIVGAPEPASLGHLAAGGLLRFRHGDQGSSNSADRTLPPWLEHCDHLQSKMSL